MKLAYNCVVNPFSALTRLPNNNVYKLGSSLEIASLVIDEVRNVAKSEGVEINKLELLECLNRVVSLKQNNKSNMYYDIENKKKSEIDFFNGKIIQLAKKNNINVPLNKTLTFLIKTIEYNFT